MDLAGEQQLGYRRALGCFATGVTVVSAEGAEGPVGLTVNSFTSVSLTPRLVLWCLDERSERGAAFLSADRFGVNVLGVEQRALSARFAEPGGGRLAPELAEFGGAGVLLLREALARFECRVVERRPLGDHIVIVGEVLAFDAREGDGLTYFRGQYGAALTPGLARP